MPAPRYVDAARNGAREDRRPPRGRGPGGWGTAGRGPGRGSQKPAEAPMRPSVVTLPHDPRFVFPFAVSVNRRVTVQLKNGSEFEGTFHGPVLGGKHLHMVLDDARKVKNARIEHGPISSKVIKSMVIPALDFVQMKVDGVAVDHETHPPAANGAGRNTGEASGSASLSEEGAFEDRMEVVEKAMEVRDNGDDIEAFEGDRDKLKSSNKGLIGRDLVKWDDRGAEPDQHTLEENGTHKQPFDQFSGKSSTFKWDDYTSKLDPSKSKYSVAQAARIAAEIEGDDVGRGNVHVAAERGRNVYDDSGLDEETLHSAVADPPERKGGQIRPPQKTQFSWADAVKGKKRGPAPAQESQQPQAHVRSAPQQSMRWGPRPTAEPEQEEQTSSMKTLSLPSSMIARQHRSQVDRSPNSYASRAAGEDAQAQQQGLPARDAPQASRSRDAPRSGSAWDAPRSAPSVDPSRPAPSREAPPRAVQSRDPSRSMPPRDAPHSRDGPQDAPRDASRSVPRGSGPTEHREVKKVTGTLNYRDAAIRNTVQPSRARVAQADTKPERGTMNKMGMSNGHVRQDRVQVQNARVKEDWGDDSDDDGFYDKPSTRTIQKRELPSVWKVETKEQDIQVELGVKEETPVEVEEAKVNTCDAEVQFSGAETPSREPEVVQTSEMHVQVEEVDLEPSPVRMSMEKEKAKVAKMDIEVETETSRKYQKMEVSKPTDSQQSRIVSGSHLSYRGAVGMGERKPPVVAPSQPVERPIVAPIRPVDPVVAPSRPANSVVAPSRPVERPVVAPSQPVELPATTPVALPQRVRQPSRSSVPQHSANQQAQPAPAPRPLKQQPVSSRVQPGISWSQKIKESIAKSQAQQPRPQPPVRKAPPPPSQGTQQAPPQAAPKPAPQKAAVAPSQSVESKPLLNVGPEPVVNVPEPAPAPTTFAPPREEMTERVPTKSGALPKDPFFVPIAANAVAPKVDESLFSIQVPAQNCEPAAESVVANVLDDIMGPPKLDMGAQAIKEAAEAKVADALQASSYPVFGSPLNAGLVTDVGGGNSLSVPSDVVKVAPQRSRNVVPGMMKGPMPPSHPPGRVDMMEPRRHVPRVSRQRREKQLNPFAPPYQPMFAPYPFGMYDPMQMMYMNDMAMSMNGMGHLGAGFRHHAPHHPQNDGGDAAQSQSPFFQAPAQPHPPNGLQQQGQVPPPQPPSGPPAPPAPPSAVAPQGPVGPPGPQPLPGVPGQPQGPSAPQGNQEGSSVVTPWPSFPGTGVWHSGQRAIHGGQSGMMNSYMPGMPGPFPMWPGMPYVPASQQDAAMWARAAMNPMGGIPDPSLGMAGMNMMWGGNYFPPQQPTRHWPNRSGGNSYRGRGRNYNRDTRRYQHTQMDQQPTRPIIGGRGPPRTAPPPAQLAGAGARGFE